MNRAVAHEPLDVAFRSQAARDHLSLTYASTNARVQKNPALTRGVKLVGVALTGKGRGLGIATAAGGGGGGGVGGGGRLGGGGGGSGGGGSFGSGGNLPQRLAYGFAVLLAIGGYLGYRKKGSKASLKASSSFAALLLAAGYLIGGPYPTAGLAIALAVNLALGTYMVRGFAATKKPFPQGVFSVISALNSVIYIKSLTNL